MHLRFNRIMAPRKTTTATSSPAMTQAAIRKLVADSVAAALEVQAAAMARTSSNNRATAESESAATRKCTYKDFIACKPCHFKGTEGVTELARWFERTETVFVRSGCAWKTESRLLLEHCWKTRCLGGMQLLRR
jgi:3-deoxy-D-arabino-heptulosonate 7-phosphate (DAHP) synthase